MLPWWGPLGTLLEVLLLPPPPPKKWVVVGGCWGVFGGCLGGARALLSSFQAPPIFSALLRQCPANMVKINLKITLFLALSYMLGRLPHYMNRCTTHTRGLTSNWSPKDSLWTGRSKPLPLSLGSYRRCGAGRASRQRSTRLDKLSASWTSHNYGLQFTICCG